VPQRPDQSGVIFHPYNLRAALQGLLFTLQVNGSLPVDWSNDDNCVCMTETRPDALLYLDPQKVRWSFRKLPWRMFVVFPHGTDVLYGDSKVWIKTPELGVWMTDDRSYARKLHRWWTGALPPLVDKRIPLPTVT
jgi:hypothetical protein